MKRYFCIAGIHGHYNELIEKLKEVEFDWLNDNHILVVVGGWMAWGEQTDKLYTLFKIFSDRVVLIEDTELEGFKKEVSYSGMSSAQLSLKDFPEEEVKALLDTSVYYFETEHYIIVSKGIPLVKKWREASRETWLKTIGDNGSFIYADVEFEEKDFFIVGGLSIEALTNRDRELELEHNTGVFSPDERKVFINGGLAAGKELLVFIFED